MAKGEKKTASKNKKLEADLVSPYGYPEDSRISIPFPLEDVGELKIGQEISVTIKGCVNRLEGDKYYSCIGLEVYEKSFRRTGNSQAEGIAKLSGDSDDYDD